MGDVGSVRAAGRVGCAIRVENKAGISSGDKSELIRRELESKVLRVIWPRKICLAKLPELTAKIMAVHDLS